MKKDQKPLFSRVHFFLLLAAVFVILFTFYIISQNPSFGGDSLETSKDIARNFILNSPTYEFDGDSLLLVTTNTLRCAYCWEHIFSFVSTHAGYGDRTGKILAQVITFHRAVVTVENGKITSVVVDNKWDELNQKLIK